MIEVKSSDGENPFLSCHSYLTKPVTELCSLTAGAHRLSLNKKDFR
jgi:hypothetical protein